MKKVIIILLTMSFTKLLISCCNPGPAYFYYAIPESIEATIFERDRGEQVEMEGGVAREFLVLKIDVNTKTASDSTELSFNGFTFNSASACSEDGPYEQHLDFIDSLKVYAVIPDSIDFEEVTNSFVVLDYGNFIEIEEYFNSRAEQLKDSPYENRRNYFDLVFARNYRGFPDGVVFKVKVFLTSGRSLLAESEPIIFEN
jgi:hypothetical protein